MSNVFWQLVQESSANYIHSVQAKTQEKLLERFEMHVFISLHILNEISFSSWLLR